MASYVEGTRQQIPWSVEGNQNDPDYQMVQWFMQRRPDVWNALRSQGTTKLVDAFNEWMWGSRGDPRGQLWASQPGRQPAEVRQAGGLINYLKTLGWEDKSAMFDTPSGPKSLAQMNQELLAANWSGPGVGFGPGADNGYDTAAVSQQYGVTTNTTPTPATTPNLTPGTPPPGWPPGVPFLVPATGQQQTLQNQQAQVRANTEAEQRRIMEQQANANYATRVGEIGQSSRNYIQSLFLGTPDTTQPAPPPPTDGSVPYWWPQGVAWPNIPAGQVPTPEQIDTYLAAWDAYERNRINEQGQNQTRQLAESGFAANPRGDYLGNPTLMASVAATAKKNPLYAAAYQNAGLSEFFSAGSNPTFGYVAGKHIPVRDMLNMGIQDRGIMESFASYSKQDPADFYADFERARPKGQVAGATRFR